MHESLSLYSEERPTFDASLIWITFIVIALHLMLMIWFSAEPKMVFPQKPPAKVLVKTVKLKAEPKVVGAAAVAPREVTDNIQVKKNPPQKVVDDDPKTKKEKPPKKEESKKKVVKSEAAKPKPVVSPKKTAPKADVKKGKLDDQKKKLLKQAQESLAKIDQTGDKMRASEKGKRSSDVPVLAPLESLTIDAQLVAGSLSKGEGLYRDELAGQLKMFLRLPEQGKVEVRLTILRTGKVASVQVVSTESEINASYVKTTLPDLTFTPFGSHFGKEAQYTFHITLMNES